MFEIQVYGDRGLRITLGDSISKETNDRIRSFSSLLEDENIKGVIEWIPTYTSISIFYDPALISYDSLRERMNSLYENISLIDVPPADVITIPVCYSKEYGPDLTNVSKHNQLTEEEVIKIHTEPDYLIYMMGFSPGFPYLGGMSEKIATPRLSSPRAKIEAGSVGIAGSQTGIYPLESPGGWQIIGRTPLKLYNPKSDHPILLRSGNYIRFTPVTEEEYQTIENAVLMGTYKPKRELFKGGEKG
ncbi:5-oxoprolinase subunit PxpB [Oceanobacillus piezotolerans]|uniref:5-oxoprolinase subunit PxpB n=1 Tax=Oceanobacillus piezotolerans TaxID=2448030 RepID=A0A498D952_9BACI|nr:5-oxoprolinase subunit PxpB [Oceanobacillus piezotolerans]RLL42826.1 5-oxoprolinase subunit PxpB [Oceanobacillus piezotolerans]